MWRYLGYWAAVSIVLAAGYALVRGVREYVTRDDEHAENEEALLERIELARQREAGTR